MQAPRSVGLSSAVHSPAVGGAVIHSAAGQGSAGGEVSEERPPRRPSPLGHFLAALAISGAAGMAGSLPGGLSGSPAGRVLSGAIPAPWHLSGLLLLAGGIALMVAADAQFKRAGTSVKPFARASALVTGGVFAFSRNPMYLGMLLALLGAAVLEGSAAAAAVAALFAWRVQRTFILPEEWRLESQFQNEYRLYRRRVRRWL